MLYFWKGGDSRLSIMIFWCVILVIWWLSYNHLMIIMLSYDDHHQTEKTQHMIYFWKLGDSTISVCHSCPKMVIQQANLFGSVHILKPYTFNLSFAQLYVVLLWISFAQFLMKLWYLICSYRIAPEQSCDEKFLEEILSTNIVNKYCKQIL